MNYIFILILLASSTSTLSATCLKLLECVELSTKISGEKIIFDRKILPPGFELNRPLEMNKENVSKTLSEALNIFGLAKIPTLIPGTAKIIEARDIRFQTDLPTYDASKKVMPKIPENQNPVMMTYETGKNVDVEIIAESVKSLLSRYGRVQAMRDGTIVVCDLASYVKKIYPLIQKQDFPLTAQERDRMALEKTRAHELEIARLKAGEMHEIGPHKKHLSH